MKVNKIDSIAKKIKPTKKSAKKGTVQQPVKKLKAKEFPNWVGLPGENYGNTVGYKVAFFPEDLEKMKTMTEEEASWYRARLFFKHKYYRDDRPIVLSEKLAAILGDLNQYIVK